MHWRLQILMQATLLFALCRNAHAVVSIWVDVPHDSDSVRSRVKNAPATDELKVLVYIMESVALADRSKSETGLLFPGCYQELSRVGVEKRLGRPIEFKPLQYVRPCAGDEIVFLKNVRPKDVTGLAKRAAFYELENVGGIRVFYSKDDIALSPAVIYLRTDEAFVPLTNDADLTRRIEWEARKLEKLKSWLGVPEEIVKTTAGDIHVKRKREK